MSNMTTRDAIEEDIWQKASLNREHVLAFLALLPTNDATKVTTTLKAWLDRLHNDPKFSNIFFAQDQIDRIMGDLESYGIVTQNTIIGADHDIMETKS